MIGMPKGCHVHEGFFVFSLLVENNPYICDKRPPREVDPTASYWSSTSIYSISIEQTVIIVHVPLNPVPLTLCP